MSLFGKGRILFSQMDKFQCWVVSQDVMWACIIKLFGLTTLKLLPIQHLVKEFL
jgi:hypothetical protein